MLRHRVYLVFTILFALLQWSSVYAQLAPVQTAGLSVSIPGFTENLGQLYDQHLVKNPAVKYIYHAAGMNVQLKANSFSYDTYEVQAAPAIKKNGVPGIPGEQMPSAALYKLHRVDITLLGANAHPQIMSKGKSSYATTYYSKENTDGIQVYQYQQLVYKEIYTGIDLVFTTGNEAGSVHFEYNFIVHPGADAGAIKLQYKGAPTQLQNNRIVIKASTRSFGETIPASYVSADASPDLKRLQQYETLGINYKTYGNGVYGFKVPAHDRSKTIIIDPTPDLVWGTYYGGSINDWAYGIARCPDGTIVVGGGSDNMNIATVGSYQVNFGGFSDAMIGKFGKDGKLLWMTYYGGDKSDAVLGICSDNAGNIFAAGVTDSQTGISTPGSYQPIQGNAALPGDGRDAFICKFNAAGNRVWATYYGGTSTDFIHSVKADANGNIVVAGWTDSPNGIASPGAWQANYVTDPDPQKWDDAFLAKFDNNGNRLWGTYYGGVGFDRFYCLDLDANGNPYASGISRSSGLASPGAFRATGIAASEALLVAFDKNGQRRWATYYGGDNEEYSTGVSCDRDNNVIIVGMTLSSTGIGTPGAYLTSAAGDVDGFLAKFNSDGQRIWGTYYGGTGQEYVRAVTTDANNNIIVTGSGFSANNIATAGSYEPVFPSIIGGWVPFISKFGKGGNLVWGTYYGKGGYFGGIGDGEAVVTDDAGNVFACGETSAPDAIATCGAVQPNWAGNQDMFVAMFSETIKPLSVSAIINPLSSAPTCSGLPQTFTAQVLNGGPNPSYQWKVNGTNAGTNNASFTSSNLNTGDLVYCAVTSNSPCISDPTANSDTLVVTVMPSVVPSLRITSTPSGQICTGANVIFNALPVNQGSSPIYQWKINGQNVGSNAAVFTTNVLVDGDVVTCSLTNTGSCNSVQTAISNNIIAKVAVAVAPAIIIKSSVTVACAGSVVNFTADTLNAGINPAYQWKVNGKLAGTASVFNSSTLLQNDTVQCFLIATGACAIPGGTASNKLSVALYPLPSFTVQPNNPIISKGDSIHLFTTGTNLNTYDWSPAVTINDSKSPSPIVWPSASQVYTLTVTSDKGCSARKDIIVGVITDIHVPNAFSPNHDGINDNWVIKGLELYPHCTVTVFNRWGQRVFYSAGYPRPWDGTINNQSIPVSSFVYIIDLKNGTKPISGVLTIIR